MQSGDFREHQESILETSRLVQSTISSRGWIIFERILNEKKEELKDIKSIKTLKDLQANNKALKIIEETLAEFKELVDEGESAQEAIKKVDRQS